LEYPYRSPRLQRWSPRW